MAARLGMTAADAEHDASCGHFQEAAWLARAALEQEDHVERLEAVAEAAFAAARAWEHDDPPCGGVLHAAMDELVEALGNVKGDTSAG